MEIEPILTLIVGFGIIFGFDWYARNQERQGRFIWRRLYWYLAVVIGTITFSANIINPLVSGEGIEGVWSWIMGLVSLVVIGMGIHGVLFAVPRSEKEYKKRFR